MSEHANRGASAMISALASELEGLAETEVSLAPLCTYRVGGAAALFARVSTVGELERIHTAITGVAGGSGDQGPPVLVIGRGSNLLVADEGFPGLVVQLGEGFESLSLDEADRTLIAGGAALMPVAARRSGSNGFSGFEWAVGVPGSIGGGVRMNAGGHGSDISANLVRVSVFNVGRGGPAERTVAELELSYRHSNLADDDVVLFAEFQLVDGDPAAGEAELAEIVRWRREHQPGGQNAGSVFANPDGDSAGRLIDSLGLKGYRVGSASVSEKHANFIQADPGGCASDVHAVIHDVRDRVFDHSGIQLRIENRLIGFGDTT